ncbi:sec-independent protein translocase protein TATB, chloroplastic-like [Impatiens glandulifera]|uniref:sec-independent protein translocase protein TATB, chloroplastic-like n=1 Tax=Impatiens glandulifera TaxID=253017 RepID=UPI001FB0B45A|nr:sec-independent protein translocase protein TATB, chloroplastic-like [Impatiens glandulifera]
MIASSMAAASSSLWTYSSSTLRKDRSTTLCAPCVIFHAKSQNSYSFKWNPLPGLNLFSSWNGLRRNLGVSIPKQYAKMERKKGKCKRNEGVGVYASLFGVGAPEALVIGVVALLVFGPKGLAEVARNLGKTLRAFQPTIRELQDVSREFKSTLEREIGLDDFQDPKPQQQQKKNIYTSSSNPNTSSDPNGAQAYSSEDYLKITEEQLKSLSSSQQQLTGNIPTTLESEQSDPQTKALTDPAQEADVLSTPPSQKYENDV